MFLLDTNVVSELMRQSPDPAVEAWVRGHTVWGSCSSQQSAKRNCATELPSCRQGVYADIASARRAAGRPVPTADCQIAAIARWRGMAVATRNVRDFVDMGIDVIDPWAHVLGGVFDRMPYPRLRTRQPHNGRRRPRQTGRVHREVHKGR